MVIDNDTTEIDWPEDQSFFQPNISGFMNSDYNNYNNYNNCMSFESRAQSINPSIFHLSHSTSYGMF